MRRGNGTDPGNMSIEDFEPVVEFEDLSFDAAITAAECRAIEQIRADAEHEFECDGFDSGTFRDAIHAVENAGGRKCVWLTSTQVKDDIVDWYDGKQSVKTDVDFGMKGVAFKYDVVVSGSVGPREAFLLSTEPPSTATPPTPFGPPLIVRSPDLVAVVRL